MWCKEGEKRERSGVVVGLVGPRMHKVMVEQEDVSGVSGGSHGEPGDEGDGGSEPRET